MTSQSETNAPYTVMIYPLRRKEKREPIGHVPHVSHYVELMSRVWPVNTLFPTIVSGLLRN